MADITLTQWIAFNDEIVSLSRAGVPLDAGLIRASQEIPGRTGRLAGTVGQQLESGATLRQILGGADFPPLYVAIVDAGLRTGRLAAALEGLSRNLRRTRELRQSAIASAIYPLTIIAIWYVLVIFFLHKIWPVMAAAEMEFAFEPAWYSRWMTRLHETLPNWCGIPPVLLSLSLIMLSRNQRAFGGAHPAFCWLFPAWRRMVESTHLAVFCDLLALLFEHHVPLPDALRLAGEASAEPKFAADCQRLADRITSGVTAPDPGSTFPPWIAWLIASGLPTPRIVAALRRLADSYQQTAAFASKWLLVALPLILTAAIGGLLTLIFAAMAIAPWFLMYWKLAQP